jgi:L-asparaginase II
MIRRVHTPDRYVPLAEVERNGLIESVHYGAVVVMDPDGTVVRSHGDISAPMLARSALKLGQAAAVLELGADRAGEHDDDIPQPWIALMSASHSGEQFHLDGVTALLARSGFTEADLMCTPKFPGNEQMRHDLMRRGAVAPTSLYADCSGKHAGMLLACDAQGWAFHSYLDPDHAVQKHIRSVLERLMGEEFTHVAVDGCGAPAFASSLTGLARMFAFARSTEASVEVSRVASAMLSHPEYVGGTGRPITQMMRAVPGLIAKEGAEGVLVGSLADGRAFAVKTADGSMRAWPVVGAAILKSMGVDTPELDEMTSAPVLGGGRRVGNIRATW